jgi:hypothetical protein
MFNNRSNSESSSDGFLGFLTFFLGLIFSGSGVSSVLTSTSSSLGFSSTLMLRSYFGFVSSFVSSSFFVHGLSLVGSCGSSGFLDSGILNLTSGS